MKLKIYNKDSAQSTGRMTGPKLSCNYKAGTLIINQAAAQLMGVKTGDAVSIMQDESEPNNWYVAKDKNGLALRQGSHGYSKHLLFNSAGIVRELMAEGLRSEHFLIAGVPTKHDGFTLWGLIRKSTI